MFSQRSYLLGSPLGNKNSVPFIDILVNMLLVYIFMNALMTVRAAAIVEKTEENDIIAPGNVIVEIFWPDSQNSDVDLWSQCPDDVPVGWSNLGSACFNLLRDDRGTSNDATRRNYENSYSRGIVPGEYTINLHWFDDASQVRMFPLPVTVVISVKYPASPEEVLQGESVQDPKKEISKQLLETEVKLNYVKEEVTAFRFKLTESGDLVPESVHAIFKPMVTAKR